MLDTQCLRTLCCTAENDGPAAESLLSWGKLAICLPVSIKEMQEVFLKHMEY